MKSGSGVVEPCWRLVAEASFRHGDHVGAEAEEETLAEVQNAGVAPGGRSRRRDAVDADGEAVEPERIALPPAAAASGRRRSSGQAAMVTERGRVISTPLEGRTG